MDYFKAQKTRDNKLKKLHVSASKRRFLKVASKFWSMCPWVSSHMAKCARHRWFCLSLYRDKNESKVGSWQSVIQSTGLREWKINHKFIYLFVLLWSLIYHVCLIALGKWSDICLALYLAENALTMLQKLLGEQLEEHNWKKKSKARELI